LAHTPLPHFRKSPPAPLPLPPDRRPQPAPDPLVQFLQHRGGFAFPEIASPPPQVAAQILGHSFDAHPTRPPRQLPYPLLESRHCLRRNTPFRLLRRCEAESQELSLPLGRH